MMTHQHQILSFGTDPAGSTQLPLLTSEIGLRTARPKHCLLIPLTNQLTGMPKMVKKFSIDGPFSWMTSILHFYYPLPFLFHIQFFSPTTYTESAEGNSPAAVSVFRNRPRRVYPTPTHEFENWSPDSHAQTLHAGTSYKPSNRYAYFSQHLLLFLLSPPPPLSLKLYKHAIICSISSFYFFLVNVSIPNQQSAKRNRQL